MRLAKSLILFWDTLSKIGAILGHVVPVPCCVPWALSKLLEVPQNHQVTDWDMCPSFFKICPDGHIWDTFPLPFRGGMSHVPASDKE